MNYYVLTLFPEIIQEYMNTSILGRAIEKNIITLKTINIRDFSSNKHNKVDDYPYGGGAGMVMQAEPIFEAYQKILSKNFITEKRVIYLTPQGRVFDQKLAIELSKEEDLIFLCGHYEGIDERVLEEMITDSVSIGDYVLTGGELPAMVMMDSIARLVSGVLNNDISADTESFTDSLLEYPQYTRPEIWRNKTVPEVLLSGHHGKVDEWRREQSILRTKLRRPDLLVKAQLTKKEIEKLEEWDKS